MIVQSRVASCSAAFLLFIGYTGRKIPADSAVFDKLERSSACLLQAGCAPTRIQRLTIDWVRFG